MNDQAFISSLESAVPTSDPLAEARTLAAGLAVRVNADKKAAFAPDVIAALKLLKEESRGDYVEALNVLKACGVAINEVKSEVAKSAKLRIAEPGERMRRLACDFLPNAPISDLVIPSNYRILPDDAGGYELIVTDFLAQETVAHCAPFITGRTKDIDGETEGTRLSWSRGDGWTHRVVDRDVIANQQKLTGLAAFGYPVTSSNAKRQVEYFAELEAANYANLPVALTTSHLGPQGKNAEMGYLVGRELIKPDGSIVCAEMNADSMDWSAGSVAFRGVSAGDKQLADGYIAEGTMDGWIEAIETVSKFPRVMAAIYTSFVPVMLDILGCRNFMLDFGGRTSGGKTTALRGAASVWGVPDEHRPDSAIHTWNIKQVFLERASVVLTGLPMILDDTKLAPNPQFIESSIYMICEGQGRGRGSVGGMAVTKHWRTVAISSGEWKATSATNAGGTKMRVVSLSGSPFGKQDDETEKIVNAFNLAIAMHYGHAGRKFVQWLMLNRRFWPEWKAEYQRRIQGYIETAAGKNSGRLAAYVAAITQTASLVHTALDFPFAFDDPMAKLWAEVSAEADDALGAKQALRYLVSWASQNEHRFDGRTDLNKYQESVTPSQGVIGRWDAGEKYESIAFYPHVIQEVLESQKFHHESILNEWRDRKWLILADEKRFTTKVWIRREGAQRRMIQITKAGIDEAFGDEPG